MDKIEKFIVDITKTDIDIRKNIAKLENIWMKPPYIILIELLI